MAHIALSPRAHRKILDAQEHSAVNHGSSVRSKAMRVSLQETHAFFFNQHLRGIGTMFRNLVPVTDVEIAHADEVVGEFAGKLVAGYVLDLEPLQVEHLRHR